MKHDQISEIQGLRGVSILLVFLFHLNAEIFSYGYLGVDIFFVISGFIITKIISQNLINNKFSLNIFFTSRFMRLIPSLFFMVIIIIFFIIVTYQIHPDPNVLINTGLTSLIGLSNFYLIFIENDYFISFDENIFEHMWSLSIEFQFYLFYPLIFAVLFKVLKNNISFYTYLYSIIIFSYILFNILFEFKYFYHTGSRIGELIIGCLTYYLYQKKEGGYFILSLSMIFFIVFFIHSKIFYLIMSVCFLTSFIILNLTRLSLLSWPLNNKFLLLVGDASYSLYLWHLPVIFFSNIFFVGLDYYFFSTFITLLLTMVSFYFIEMPFRNSSRIRNFTLTRIFTLKKLGLVTSILVIFFIYIDLTNSKNEILKNQNELYENITNKISLFNLPEMKKDRDKTCHEKYGQMIFKSECFKTNNSNELIYFFGDSSMYDFFYSFKISNIKMDKLFTSYNNSSFWKPILKGYANVDPTYELIKNYDLVTKNYDEVFLILSFNHNFNYTSVNKSGSYYEDQEKAYSEFIKSLPKNIKLIFIKDTPQFRYSARNCFIINKVTYELFDNNNNNNKCDHSKNDILKKMSSINLMFANLKAKHKIEVISLDDYFCGDKRCSFYKSINSKKFAKKNDRHHLTVDASKNISQILNERVELTIINLK
jgi:peptidoglycan/LPS O-acetylase OafA/YrhL